MSDCSTDYDSFICDSLFVQWQIFNFIDFEPINEPTCKNKCFRELIRNACVYGGANIVNALLACYPAIANESFDGDTILHLVCRSKVEAKTGKSSAIQTKTSKTKFKTQYKRIIAYSCSSHK